MEDQNTMSDLSQFVATPRVSQLPISQPRLVAYARVSTDDQNLSLQIDALSKQEIPQHQFSWTSSQKRRPTDQD